MSTIKSDSGRVALYSYNREFRSDVSRYIERFLTQKKKKLSIPKYRNRFPAGFIRHLGIPNLSGPCAVKVISVYFPASYGNSFTQDVLSNVWLERVLHDQIHMYAQ